MPPGLRTPPGAAGVAGIIGIVVALWSAPGYVAAFMRASNAIYDVDEGRPVWKTGRVRLLTTLALVVMLVIAAAIVVLTGAIANQVGTAFGIGHAAVLIWDIAKWPVLVIIVSVMYSLLYKSQPERPAGRLPVGFGRRHPGRHHLADRLRAVRRLRQLLRLLQQDLRIARHRNHFPGLVVDLQHRDPARGRVQRRDPARTGHPCRAAEDVEPFAELRDTRKLNDPEKRRVDQARRTRDRTMDPDR